MEPISQGDVAADGKLSILLVDDDLDLLRGLARILKANGYSVDTASSIKELMDRENWAPYIAILLDRRLPDGTAEDVLPQLKELAPEAALFIITGNADLQSSIAALRHGAYDYLLKPLEPEALLIALERVAGENRRKRELARVKQVLSEQRRILESILNSLNDGVIVVDKEGNLLHHNPAAERIVGRRAQVSLDEWAAHYGAYLPDQVTHYPTAELPIMRAMAGEVVHAEMFIASVEGCEGTWCSVSAGPLLDENKDVQGGIMVLRDITERKLLEKEVLSIAAEEQRRIGQDLHDGVGQELTGLSLYAAGLIKSLDAAEGALQGEDSTMRRIRDTAAKVAEGLMETEEHVKQLSRGMIPVQLDAEGLMAALERLAHLTDQIEGIACIFDCAESVEAHDVDTATNLFRIAQEAVKNALKHSQATEIRIAFRRVEDRIVLEISDNGVGIDSQLTDADAKVGYAGGMGLHIMRYRAGLIGAGLSVAPGASGGAMVQCTVRYLEATPSST